ncbi:hypothetical protein M702_04825 [Neisseria gonorrhoeae SK28355]|nr:hypothetical protein M680_03345 [Neisseria gonorrhoeae SK8976]KLR79649.1 hypothetical protein M679_02025 [Neisseria gonorrhoeae SK7842]KLR85837.1 hypothetical protein M684_06700 [Neisseria gonorrhoeae SK15454]KLR87786.1 hypothetical protein M702_04825 [Neisseria gonorrhoeae SK28355]KLR92709.1 hypothetical protein M685_02895 [Neisseria gonorrhoeae SK16259]KLR99158.1 hypothetical protein M683_08815 [Neisseria gonorrhoeae SK14515]KLS04814.1 hypothetical protein M686_08950 [Neisseria gonorrhoe
MNRQIWTFRRLFLKTIKTQSFKIKKETKSIVFILRYC